MKGKLSIQTTVLNAIAVNGKKNHSDFVHHLVNEVMAQHPPLAVVCILDLGFQATETSHHL